MLIYTPDNLVGFVSRSCSLNGTWKAPIYECSRQEILTGFKEIDVVLETPSNTTVGIALSLLSNLTKGQELLDNEIRTTVTVLDKIVNSSDKVTEAESEDFFVTVDNLLDKRNAISWNSLSQTSDEQEQQSVATVLNLVEEYGKRIADSHIDEESSRTISAPNIEAFVGTIDNENGPSDILFATREGEVAGSTHLFLGKESLYGSSAYVSVIYHDLTNIVTSKALGNSTDSVAVNTPVLGLVLVTNNDTGSTTSSKTDLPQPIQLNFRHLQGGYINPICSFLDHERNLWDTRGCSLKSTSADVTVCECSHLTNFAVLMSPWHKNNVDEIAINVISYIGCILSTTGLVITVTMHIFLWRYVKADRVYILINLSMALVISYIIFLAGVTQTENKGGCTTVAVLLHYFYLVVFFLMLVEGIEIAVIVLYVFPTKSRLKWMLPLAWGTPAIIVAISMAATKLEGYGTDQFCWLSVENNLVWSFVGPTLLIILANFVLLLLVIRKMFRTTAIQVLKIKDKVKTGVRCLCILVPLMGCSWVLGVFYVSEDAAWIQYVFALCNSLQGVTIFIFHCLFNEKIKMAIKSRRKRLSDSVSTVPKSSLTLTTEKILADEKKNTMVMMVDFRRKPEV